MLYIVKVHRFREKKNGNGISFKKIDDLKEKYFAFFHKRFFAKYFYNLVYSVPLNLKILF